MLWFVVVTMTTVGYGDYYPRTIPGRLQTFVLAVWGSVVLSLTVNILEDVQCLEDIEKKSLDYYEALTLKDNLKQKASNVLVQLIKTNLEMKKKGNFRKQLQYSNQSYAIKEFQRSSKLTENAKLNTELDQFYDKIAQDVGSIRENILSLNWRQDKKLNLSRRMLCLLYGDKNIQSQILNIEDKTVLPNFKHNKRSINKRKNINSLNKSSKIAPTSNLKAKDPDIETINPIKNRRFNLIKFRRNSINSQFDKDDSAKQTQNLNGSQIEVENVLSDKIKQSSGSSESLEKTKKTENQDSDKNIQIGINLEESQNNISNKDIQLVTKISRKKTISRDANRQFQRS